MSKMVRIGWMTALSGVVLLGSGLRTASAQEEWVTRARPLAGWDRGFYLESPDGLYRLNLGGWIQPRYEYRSDDENTSSFTMRRVRLDVRGHAIVPELTYRMMSEHARTSNLRDAWIDYAFSSALQVRMGQFTVPFQWHRDVGPRRQHFAERGVPSETFGFQTGRDIGLMVHGIVLDDRVGYKAGLFDGAGRNADRSNSDGNMASARLTWAALGGLPREESAYAHRDEWQLSFGTGAQGAWRNERRDWSLSRSEDENERADWVTGTIDGRVAWRGLSLVVDGYLRHVSPDDDAVDSYEGWGGMVSAGAFLIPKQLELVGRWSRLRLDRDVRDTQVEEWALGLNAYHRGHDWKTRLNYFNENHASAGQSDAVVLEWHLQF